jgi:hypothetical protein
MSTHRRFFQNKQRSTMASILITMDDASALRYDCVDTARAALTSGAVPATVEQVLKSALTVAAGDAPPEPELPGRGATFWKLS